MNLKNLIKALFVCFVLFGCASLAPRDSEYTWVKSERPSLPMTIKVVSEYPDYVKKMCKHGSLLWACAVFYVKDINVKPWVYTECVVYTTNKNLPQFILDHENKHCDGWDHKEP